jgi:hypothetical protein
VGRIGQWGARVPSETALGALGRAARRSFASADPALSQVDLAFASSDLPAPALYAVVGEVSRRMQQRRWCMRCGPSVHGGILGHQFWCPYGRGAPVAGDVRVYTRVRLMRLARRCSQRALCLARSGGGHVLVKAMSGLPARRR